MSRVTDMTHGNPVKLMLHFAFPVILTNIGQQLYQIADATIVGRGVGVDALAAVGCTDWTYWIVLWSVSVMTAGFATFVSKYFGMQDYKKMNQSIWISALLSAMIAVIFTVAGLLLARPVLVFLGTPANILEDAVIYLSTMIAGTMILAAYNLTAAILRAFGDGKSPLVAMAIAATLNIALDLLCVIVFKWGVFGAALASVTSQLVAFLYCLRKILKIEIVKFDKESLAWDGPLAGEILIFGLPLAIQYIIINTGGVVVQSTINMQGSDFVAGYTAVTKLYGLLECTAIAMGSAFTTFASQNFGAGQFKRVRSGVNTAMFLAVGSALAIMAVVLPLNRILPQLFMDASKDGAAEALNVASHYLIRMILSMPILYLVYVHRHFLQAIGIVSWSLISGIAEAIVRVLVGKALFYVVGREALFFVEPAAWLTAWLFVLVPYYFYQRKRLPLET